MTIKITCTGINENKLVYEILKRIKVEINKRFRKAIPNVLREFRLLVKGAIENEPTYQAILYGDLRHELGIKNPDTVLGRLVTAVINGIVVDYKPVVIKGSELYAELNIGILAADLSDVLGKDFARYVSENGKEVPWLKWLLVEGDKFINLKGYEFIVDPEVVTKSRTHKGIMIQSKRSWRVPPVYSGTESNNFLTRALEDLEAVVDKIIAEEFQLKED